MDPNSSLVYDGNKAGLSAPADEIKSKILSMSKGSKFYELKQKQSKRAEKQILEMKSKLKHTSENEFKFAAIQVEAYLQSLEKMRDFSKTYLHADLDSFFASCEALRDPSLAGTAFAVGGEIKHGVLSTTSYEARKTGVRSGMAVFIALQLCPNLKIVESHYDLYQHYSNLVREVFAEYDPNYTSFGLDEATLDISKLVGTNYEKAVEIAKNIQKEVFEKTKLTISCGIAPTPQLAKIASDVNKPNGIFEVIHDKEFVLDFVSKLSIRKIPGIGGVAEQILHGLEIQTMKDVLDRKTDLWICMRPLFCEFIFCAALGVNRVSFGVSGPQQSVSKERTFDNTNDRVFLEEIIEKLCVELCKIMENMKVMCRNVTLKFKDSNFQVITRCISFDHDTNKLSEIVPACFRILSDELRSRYVKYRLLGVRCGQLTSPGAKRQISIKTMITKMNEKIAATQKAKEEAVANDEIVEYYSQQYDEEEQEYEDVIDENYDDKVVIENEESQEKIVVDKDEFIELENQYISSQQEEQLKNPGKKNLTLFDFFEQIKENKKVVKKVEPKKKKKTKGFLKRIPSSAQKSKQVQKVLPF